MQFIDYTKGELLALNNLWETCKRVLSRSAHCEQRQYCTCCNCKTCKDQISNNHLESSKALEAYCASCSHKSAAEAEGSKLQDTTTSIAEGLPGYAPRDNARLCRLSVRHVKPSESQQEEAKQNFRVPSTKSNSTHSPVVASSPSKRLQDKPRRVIKIENSRLASFLIENKYLIEEREGGGGFRELGSGQFGRVYAGITEIKCQSVQEGLWSGISVAVKEVSKKGLQVRQWDMLKNEADILGRLSHPGVILLEEVHDCHDRMYIVMEQLEGDMLEMILAQKEKRLSERVTKFLTFQILEALKYLHSQNIAHCDLKPENVLLVQRNALFPQIKLADFGYAKIIEEDSFRKSLIGTPAYLAPEVVKGELYNRSVDLWSVGVIVYVSLSGEFPFNDGDSIQETISSLSFLYPDHPWKSISSQSKSFINSLLSVDSKRRQTVHRAQMHTWIQDFLLWCDLRRLENRIGKRWLTNDANLGRWSKYSKDRDLHANLIELND